MRNTIVPCLNVMFKRNTIIIFLTRRTVTTTGESSESRYRRPRHQCRGGRPTGHGFWCQRVLRERGQHRCHASKCTAAVCTGRSWFKTLVKTYIVVMIQKKKNNTLFVPLTNVKCIRFEFY